MDATGGRAPFEPATVPVLAPDGGAFTVFADAARFAKTALDDISFDKLM
jgi:hypothetical protein